MPKKMAPSEESRKPESEGFPGGPGVPASRCCQFLEHLLWLSCKAPSKTRLLLPHVCSVGLLCNLETCNVTNCGCQKKNSAVKRHLSFCEFPKPQVRRSVG